jgi:hypothetical protein
MGWPKHKYGWIVLGGWNGPIRDNGCGSFTESGFAEVFLDEKAMQWVKRYLRNSFLRLAKSFAEDHAAKREWLRKAANVRSIRIALPGTYPQFRAPGRIERQLAREARVCDTKPRLVRNYI